MRSTRRKTQENIRDYSTQEEKMIIIFHAPISMGFLILILEGSKIVSIELGILWGKQGITTNGTRTEVTNTEMTLEELTFSSVAGECKIALDSVSVSLTQYQVLANGLPVTQLNTPSLMRIYMRLRARSITFTLKTK